MRKNFFHLSLYQEEKALEMTVIFWVILFFAGKMATAQRVESERNIIMYISDWKNLNREEKFSHKTSRKDFRCSSSQNWLNRHLSFGLAFKNVKAKVLAEMEFSHIFRETCADEFAATKRWQRWRWRRDLMHDKCG